MLHGNRLTGMVPIPETRLRRAGGRGARRPPQLAWLSPFVKAGVIAGMTSVILTSLLGQPADTAFVATIGLLPPFMQRCQSRFKTRTCPRSSRGVRAFIAPYFHSTCWRTLFPWHLLAFAVVCLGVLVLRYTRPDAHRPFRCHGHPSPAYWARSCAWHDGLSAAAT